MQCSQRENNYTQCNKTVKNVHRADDSKTRRENKKIYMDKLILENRNKIAISQNY